MTSPCTTQLRPFTSRRPTPVANGLPLSHTVYLRCGQDGRQMRWQLVIACFHLHLSKAGPGLTNHRRHVLQLVMPGITLSIESNGRR